MNERRALRDIWRSMIRRCDDPRLTSYRSYGGRGIRVHPSWYDFGQFAHDIGPRPSSGHSIDRYPNNDGHYEPGNVRWATAKEQAANRAPKFSRQSPEEKAVSLAKFSAAGRRAAALHRKPPKLCLQCGNPYDPRARTATGTLPGHAYGDRKYCSHECYWRSKAALTDEQVRQARQDWHTGTSISDLARRHGLHRITMRDILRRLTYRHVAGSHFGSRSHGPV